jgi:hypothetical protein
MIKSFDNFKKASHTLRSCGMKVAGYLGAGMKVDGLMSVFDLNIFDENTFKTRALIKNFNSYR